MNLQPLRKPCATRTSCLTRMHWPRIVPLGTRIAMPEPMAFSTRFIMAPAALAVLLSGVTASAESKSPTELEDPEWKPLESFDSRPVNHWYGWQVMIPVGVFDMIAAIRLADGAQKQGSLSRAFWGPDIMLLALAGRGFGAPIVHLAHGNVGKAFGSFALELLVPAAPFAFLGMVGSVGTRGSAWNGPGMAMVVIIPALIGTTIDTFLVANEPSKKTQKVMKGIQVSDLSLAPIVMPFPTVPDAKRSWVNGFTSGAMGLGVSGRF